MARYSATALPAGFGTTVIFEPRVIMPMEQLKPMSPTAWGVKEMTVG
jgi:hypothetical protein